MLLATTSATLTDHEMNSTVVGSQTARHDLLLQLMLVNVMWSEDSLSSLQIILKQTDTCTVQLQQ